MKWLITILIVIIAFSSCTNNTTDIADNNIKLHVVYDYLGKDESYISGDGLSTIIEIGDKAILFDTPYKDARTEEGESGFYSNMALMNLKATDIDLVVISHSHSVNGLRKFLDKKEDVDLYVTSDLDLKYHMEDYDINPIVVDELTEVNKNVYIMPELEGSAYGQHIQEQVIVLKSDKGLIVLIGCAHPGIENIVQAVEKHFSDENIYLVYGGFHFKSEYDETVLLEKLDYLSDHNVEVLAPCHCTGDLFKTLAKVYEGIEFLDVSAGISIEIE